MTYREIDAVIAGIGLPYSYYEFPDDTPQSPPFICYYFEGSDDFAADDSNYQAIRPLTIELYTDNKDFELEARVESALKAAELVYTRDESYIGSERMFQITYDMEVVING